MRALMCLLLLVLYCSPAYSQAPSIEWYKNYPLYGDSWIRAAISNGEGGLLICGTYEISTPNHKDFVARVTAEGELAWKTEISITGGPFNLVRDYEGNVYVALMYKEEIVALSSDGKVKWRVPSRGRVHVLHISQSGHILCAGEKHHRTFPHPTYPWIARFTLTGSFVDSLFYQTRGPGTLRAITEDSSGNFYVTGDESLRDNSQNGTSDLFLQKLSSDFEPVWTKLYGGSNQEKGYNIQLLNDGNLLLAGDAYSNDNDLAPHLREGDGNFWLIKFDTSGSILWQRTPARTGPGYGSSLVTEADGSFLAIPQWKDLERDAFRLTGFDSLGRVQWKKDYKVDTSILTSSLIRASDPKFIYMVGVRGADSERRMVTAILKLRIGSSSDVAKANPVGSIRDISFVVDSDRRILRVRTTGPTRLAVEYESLLGARISDPSKFDTDGTLNIQIPEDIPTGSFAIISTDPSSKLHAIPIY